MTFTIMMVSTGVSKGVGVRTMFPFYEIIQNPRQKINKSSFFANKDVVAAESKRCNPNLKFNKNRTSLFELGQ